MPSPVPRSGPVRSESLDRFPALARFADAGAASAELCEFDVADEILPDSRNRRDVGLIQLLVASGEFDIQHEKLLAALR